jgi:enoyl-[acyl-carrier protein] reductase I
MVDLKGQTAVVFGLANKRSIAWAIAQKLSAAGAQIAICYQMERLRPEAEALAEELPDAATYECDVSSDEQIYAVFAKLKERYGKLDILVHSVAFAPADALQNDFLLTTRDAFRVAHEISVYSLIALSRAAAPLMTDGGSIMTMTYYGSQKVVPRYNVMGVAKAALEAAVRYVAAELGPKGIRVHAISPGPLATRAASGIPDFDELMDKAQSKAPSRSLVSIDDVGNATAFLALDGAKLITGDVLYIDGGYHIID